jgi:hypothetical protein
MRLQHSMALISAIFSIYIWIIGLFSLTCIEINLGLIMKPTVLSPLQRIFLLFSAILYLKRPGQAAILSPFFHRSSIARTVCVKSHINVHFHTQYM